MLDSEDEGRAIVINLPAGEKLKEHQVHERAWVLVVSGEVAIEIRPDGDAASGRRRPDGGVRPDERHEVAPSEDSRLLLVLAPWPGDGHPSRRD